MTNQSTRTLMHCNTLQELIDCESLIGETGKEFKDLSAASTKNNIMTLHNLLMEFKPKTTLEIGLAFGASCLTFGESHKQLNHSPSEQHTAIDPFQSTVWDNVARKLVNKEGLSDYINIIENYSYAALPRLLSDGETFDFIYIDGSHLFEDVFLDFYYSSKLLNETGIIAFDDSSDRHVRKALSFIDLNLSNSYKPINISKYRLGLDKYKHKLSTVLKKNQLSVYQKIGKAERPWNSKFLNF